MVTLRQHFFSSLVYLLIIAVLGFLLRNFTAELLPLDLLRNYKFTVHAHSHIALLGWVYIALSTLLVKVFLPERIIKKQYYRLFIFTQFTILGMLITFPLQGYAVFSIIFSTLFLLATYVLWYLIIKYTNRDKKRLFSFRIAQYALFYLGFSSIGPWALGAIVVTLGKTSIWYKLAIYFYLHFQYNAWFILAIMAILMYLFEKKGLVINVQWKRSFLLCMNAGTIFSFFLSTLWTNSADVNYLISNLGNVLLISGVLIFVAMIRKPALAIFSRSSSIQKIILLFIALIFAVKLIFQVANGLPMFNDLISYNKDLVIFYLHWYFLGFITPVLLVLAEYFRWIQVSKWALLIYALAFISTEVLIAYRAFMPVLELNALSGLNDWLVIASGLFSLSVLMIIITHLKRS